MVTRKPFAEGYGFDLSEPHEARLVEALTHYDLPNGWTVSVLHSAFGWEAWAFPTRGPDEEPATPLTPKPIVFGTEPDALAYRDAIAEGPDAVAWMESRGQPIKWSEGHR